MSHMQYRIEIMAAHIRGVAVMNGGISCTSWGSVLRMGALGPNSMGPSMYWPMKAASTRMLECEIHEQHVHRHKEMRAGRGEVGWDMWMPTEWNESVLDGAVMMQRKV